MAKNDLPFTPTHAEGCQIAARYAKTKMNCGIVFVEPNPQTNFESPDTIGFRPAGCSILFEVKVSRGDYTSDKRKQHRMDPSRGMGDWRFYVCPEGMISPNELPAGWGLFYFTSRGSLKPVAVPHFASSLQTPAHYQMLLDRHAMSGGRMPGYLQTIQLDMERFGNTQKNSAGEIAIMYGGYRMQCVAQKQGVPIIIDEIFRRPQINERA